MNPIKPSLIFEEASHKHHNKSFPTYYLLKRYSFVMWCLVMITGQKSGCSCAIGPLNSLYCACATHTHAHHFVPIDRQAKAAVLPEMRVLSLFGLRKAEGILGVIVSSVQFQWKGDSGGIFITDCGGNVCFVPSSIEIRTSSSDKHSL